MGSKTGWIIAVGLIAIVGLLTYAVFNPRPSLPRDSTAPGFMELQRSIVPLADAIGMEPSAPGNAADDYHKAIQVYAAKGESIKALGQGEHWDALMVAKDPWSDSGLAACREILDYVAAGTQKKKMEYTFQYTPKSFHFGYHYPQANRFSEIAVALDCLERMHIDRKEYAAAEPILKHMLILGVHMLEERCIPHVGSEGLDVQSQTVKKLQRLYSNKAWLEAPRHRLPALKRYEDSLRPAIENYTQKKRILWDHIPADERPGVPMMSAGDVYNVADNDKDRAWRVQATICLGAVKFRFTGRGDEKKTASIIAKHLRDDDPFISAAAKVADELTAEQFRRSGTPQEGEGQ